MPIDFGVYHHSTREQSEKLRRMIKELFFEAFERTEIPKDKEISVLDVGCGLGFLSYITALYFHRARVLGVDTFEDPSLPNSSIHKAEENMRALNLNDRVSFKKLSILEISEDLGSFDLIVSNLVFHNLGERRFIAYENVAKVMKGSSFFINGDLFFGDVEEGLTREVSKVSKVLRLDFLKKVQISPSVFYYLAILTKVNR